MWSFTPRQRPNVETLQRDALDLAANLENLPPSPRQHL
jgi:hypothetical protein